MIFLLFSSQFNLSPDLEGKPGEARYWCRRFSSASVVVVKDKTKCSRLRETGEQWKQEVCLHRAIALSISKRLGTKEGANSDICCTYLHPPAPPPPSRAVCTNIEEKYCQKKKGIRFVFGSPHSLCPCGRRHTLTIYLYTHTHICVESPPPHPKHFLKHMSGLTGGPL